MAIFTIKDLTFTYNNAAKPALTDVNLEINAGEFVLISGESGCGKTTLLRLMKNELRPAGDMKGQIFFGAELLSTLDNRRSAREIGFVMQNPDNQIVTDNVKREMGFCGESLGESKEIIRSRTAEIMQLLGISHLYSERTDELSGGEKQLVNLAAVTVMRPKVLLLDEPTGQLDPIAAENFMNSLIKLHDLGTTIILVEHKLEHAFPIADKSVIMEKGRIAVNDKPLNIYKNIENSESKEKIMISLPQPLRIAGELSKGHCLPLTVNEGMSFIRNYYNSTRSLYKPDDRVKDEVIKAKDICFRYKRELPDILKNLNLSVRTGELYAVLGANGSGKSTLLKSLAALCKPYSGKIKIFNKNIKDYKGNSLYRHNLAFLAQNPQNLFIASSVGEEIDEFIAAIGTSAAEVKKIRNYVIDVMDLSGVIDTHPYDLSGGEQQRAAMAKILVADPKLLLLDEPTKGLDAYSKERFAGVLRELKARGKTIVIATHDTEFAADNADRCAMIFDGEIVTEGATKAFFGENYYYTTAAAAMTRGHYDAAVTVKDAITLCRLNGVKREL